MVAPSSSAPGRSWPAARIIFRGDSGFCRHRMLDWCERHGMGYILGIARNARLESLVEEPLCLVELLHELTGEMQREYFRLYYSTNT